MFFEVEQLLIERLEAKSAEKGVSFRTYSVSNLEEAKPQHAPAVFVAYQGFSVKGEAGRKNKLLEQDYLVIVCAKASRQNGGKSIRDQADEVMSVCLEALIGWRPNKKWSHVDIDGGLGAEFEANYGYFPIGVKCSKSFSGDSN